MPTVDDLMRRYEDLSRRAADLHALPVPPELALVRRDGPVDHLHQGRLAGAVLAEDRADLAGRDAQAHPVAGQDLRVALGDVDELEAQHGAATPCYPLIGRGPNGAAGGASGFQMLVC